VTRYWHPEEFEALERAARDIGFESVASGPLVRSSYHADESAREAQEAIESRPAAG
jgi:lipoyl synthase